MKHPRHYIYTRSLIVAFGFLPLSFIPSPIKAQQNTDTTTEQSAGDTTLMYGEEEGDATKNTNQAASLPDSIIFRSVPDTVVNKLKADRAFEYANNPEYWIKKKENQTESKGLGYFIEWLFDNSAARMVAYLVLAAIILYTIYRIIVNNDLFYSSSKKLIEVKEEFDSEMKDDELDEKINAAIAGREYRNATRFLFFKTLRGLDAKGWIMYSTQATNFEYLNQVNKYPIASDFQFLTRVYEFTWYGGFDLTGDQFSIVYSQCQKIYKVIGV